MKRLHLVIVSAIVVLVTPALVLCYLALFLYVPTEGQITAAFTLAGIGILTTFLYGVTKVDL